MTRSQSGTIISHCMKYDVNLILQSTPTNSDKVKCSLKGRAHRPLGGEGEAPGSQEAEEERGLRLNPVVQP